MDSTPAICTRLEIHGNGSSGKAEAKETIAFAFDIDGVLVKGNQPVPGARETIKMLQDKKIPFIFLTNGGGLTEKDHVARLGQRLGLTLDEKQFVQSHTPFRELVPKYRDKNILAIGGHGQQIRNVAASYGFNKVITTSDLMYEFDHIHPFPEMTRAHHIEHGRLRADSLQGHGLAIDAILVWSSPRDWCLDLQVITDLLGSSGGRFGNKSLMAGDISLPNHGYLQDGQPKLYFCNPDFEWPTQHEHPRFAQGAFREALRGIWAYATKGKGELEYTMIGKPSETTYTYGEKVLQKYNDHLNEKLEVPRRIKTVYMVGDNPESDILGANNYESKYCTEWKSILVESGMHVRGSTPAYAPKHITESVVGAVEWALKDGNMTA
ncbi:HAD-like domain-containing protein [Pseudomassariella vexata]|uniref:HAD-like domain-containing protein n=1 Tax=Pseudomassariella vexata TaxID=1141098 RepID=A0A1Y2E1X2_9PEZI|nr:HAD-like domain-containing protein [Pseudomassariella vexata]ORY65540.1 HAD-like domain-containing protein [Pseudomassariella vexata]